jgi:hypothetical protein
MSIEEKIKRCTNMKRRDLGSRLILFSPDTEVILELNDTAKFIWEICEGRTMEDILALYAQEYGIEIGDARVDVEDVLSDLKTKGCIS